MNTRMVNDNSETEIVSAYSHLGTWITINIDQIKEIE